MNEKMKFICPLCHHEFKMPLRVVEEEVRVSKIGRVGRVVCQLMMKQGPYYDRWKAAMDARGEQKRCMDCERYGPKALKPEYQWCAHTGQRVNPGRFACRMFIDLGRG